LCVALIVANVVFLAGVDKTRPTVIYSTPCLIVDPFNVHCELYRATQ